MNWLYERKMKEGGGSKSGGGNGGAAAVASEPEPYLDSEMGGGYGDSYSFIGADTSAQGDGGMHQSMRHNFTYLNGQDGVSTREASNFQTTNSNAKRSKKEEMLDAQMEQYKASRDVGIPQRVARQ
jgi:hypothetical protein